MLASISNPGTLIVVAFILAIASSSGWRVWQLVRRLQTWRDTVREMTT